MVRIISLPFEYNDQPQHCLVKVKEVEQGMELKVTIMNGELETLLFGNHIFQYINGQLKGKFSSEQNENGRLLSRIAEMLSKYFEKPLSVMPG